MEDFEIEKMRQQMNILKNKLEKQQIINDRILRNSMKRNIYFINRRNICLCILCILMIPYSYWVFIKMMDFSIAFWIGTCIFMLICFGATLYNTLRINPSEITNENLLKTYEKIAHAKKFDTNWLLFGIPMAIIWLAWFFYETYQRSGQDEIAGLLYGGCFGVIIGGALGFMVYLKTQRKYREILEHIKEVTEQ